MLKIDLELESRREQFGWYGFFMILLVYSFKYFIFYSRDFLYSSYILSLFASCIMGLTEFIINFLMVLIVVKFIVKLEVLESGVFKKFIINILIPACILVFLDEIVNKIYYEGIKYEIWYYICIVTLCLINILKGFIWIAGIFILISDKDFVLFDFIKKLSEKISMFVALPLIIVLISLDSIFFNFLDILSALFDETASRVLCFTLGFMEIYTILGILLFFANMLINSSDKIKNSENKDILFVVTFIRENMPFFISRVVIPQVLLFFIYGNITNIVPDTGWGEIFIIVLKLLFFVFGALVEAVVLKLIFNAFKFPVKQSLLGAWLFGIYGLFAGNWFRILSGKAFILFSERGEDILRDFSRVENIYDIAIASTYMTLTFIFMIVFTIFSICIGWATKNQWRLDPSAPLAFIWFSNPIKVSIISFVGFVVFFYHYSVSQKFYFSFGFMSEPLYLLILFSSIVVGSVFLVYLAFKFTVLWNSYEKAIKNRR